MENYLIAMAVSAGIYALMALGVNVMWGFAGMVNLGLVGFFAVGAYARLRTPDIRMGGRTPDIHSRPDSRHSRRNIPDSRPPR